MADALAHRGPDDRGAWADPAAGIAIGFRRLSILDLSPEGHQPMVSASGRFVIAFNGEVYNHAELKREIEEERQQPLALRGHSDTEIVLAAIEQWGLRAAITRFVGMFAFAVWNNQERTLQLARDRLGEKPLYFGWIGSTFLFGSELKALRRYPAFQPEIRRDVLVRYLRYGYIPAPDSIYRGIYKLPPGTILSLNQSSRTELLPVQYWSLRKVIQAASEDPSRKLDSEAIDDFERAITSAVRQQMVADVPLGAFLSGGVDSSTIVALMQAQSSRPVQTFTIGFREADFDEAAHASSVARHLGTQHTELYVTPREAMDIIPELPSIYDEPFADPSQIPTCLVSKLAARSVKVSLSGDGADELFAGYPWYARTVGVWNRMRWVPYPLRRSIGQAVQAVAADRWTSYLGRRSRGVPSGERVHRVGQFIDHAKHPVLAHEWLTSKWQDSAMAVMPGCAPGPDLKCQVNQVPGGVTQSLQYFDAIQYLPDDILTKVDRASMSTSLESRAPYLNHHVVELACGLRLDQKIRHGEGKWILRQVLYRHVPQSLVDRPKSGFCVPIGEWLRGPLRAWAEELLHPARIQNQGYLRPDLISHKWGEHVSGQRDWQHHLWHTLMFQAWLETQ